jgi:hypothetical protein
MSEIRATTISNAAGTGPITMTGSMLRRLGLTSTALARWLFVRVGMLVPLRIILLVITR